MPPCRVIEVNGGVSDLFMQDVWMHSVGYRVAHYRVDTLGGVSIIRMAAQIRVQSI